MSRLPRALAVVVLAAALPLSAAAADTFRILSFDNGYAFGYNLASNNWNVASSFGLSVQITDTVSVGFNLLDGDGTVFTDFRLLEFNYQLFDKAGLSVSVGSTGGNLAAGIGLEMIAFQRRFQDALASELSLQLDYLFQPGSATAGVTAGILSAGLVFSIGL
jgi:hypothetical protein